MARLSDFYKNNPSDKVMWTSDLDSVGEFLFSFDGIKIYNLFRDFPHELTSQEVRIFCEENPKWAEYFSDRLKKR